MKKIIFVIVSIFIVVSSIEFLKKDSMENIKISTSIYPINYIIEYLYKDKAIIESIYPSDTNPKEYKLTEKQINDFSKNNLFIFNGLGNERDYAVKMLNNNRNLRIIDVSLGMEINKTVENLWLNPYNFLMFAQNIKKGLNEYIVSPVLLKEINDNYEKLKLSISELDATIKLMIDTAPNKTIVVSNNMFNFLEKYGITVISLEETPDLTDKTINDVKKLIANKKIKNIFTVDDDEVNNTINNLIKDTDIKIEKLHSLSNLTTDNLNNKDNYFTIMNNNINLIKTSLY